MGIFDNLKKVTNFISGGGASVQCEILDASISKSLKIKMTAQIKDSEVKIKKAYIKLNSSESYKLSGYRQNVLIENKYREVQLNLGHTIDLFSQEFPIAEEQTLKANQTTHKHDSEYRRNWYSIKLKILRIMIASFAW